MCCGTETGSYLRLIYSCITQLKAQGPSRTCNESKEEAYHLTMGAHVNPVPTRQKHATDAMQYLDPHKSHVECRSTLTCVSLLATECVILGRDGFLGGGLALHRGCFGAPSCSLPGLLVPAPKEVARALHVKAGTGTPRTRAHTLRVTPHNP